MADENGVVQGSDWACPNCSSLNHRRRNTCWKCGDHGMTVSVTENVTRISRQPRFRYYRKYGRKLFFGGIIVLLLLAIVRVLPASLFGIMNESEWLQKKGVRTQDQWVSEHGILNYWAWKSQSYWGTNSYYANYCETYPVAEYMRDGCNLERTFLDNAWKRSDTYKASQQYFQSQDYLESQKWEGSSEKAANDAYQGLQHWLNVPIVAITAALCLPIAVWFLMRFPNWIGDGLAGGWIFTMKRVRGRENSVWLVIILFGLIPLALWVVFMIIMMVAGTEAKHWAEAATPSKKQCEECKGWNDFAATRCKHCGQVIQATTA